MSKIKEILFYSPFANRVCIARRLGLTQHYALFYKDDEYDEGLTDYGCHEAYLEGVLFCYTIIDEWHIDE